MRQSSPDPGARADLYRAAVEMCAWAESRGCLGAVFSQHHGSDDGYLPSPVPVAAAVAARTQSLSITVGALLLAFYEPVKLAEDLAVVDLLSRGRVIYVIGIGYRDEEFEMFGVDRRRRASLVEGRIRLLQQLWSGEPADVDGRQVRVTPLPFTPGGPMLAYGGGTVAAARRAGRLGLLFLSESHDATLEEAYRAEGGPSAPGCYFPPSERPPHGLRRGRPRAGLGRDRRYLLADARGYGAWNEGRTGTASVSFATTVDELSGENGAYRILTPDEARALVAAGRPLGLQPLVGGLPPDLAWPYLEAAASI